MKKTVLFGHGGSYNHGCEAIVRSTAKIIGLNPENAVLFTSGENSDREFGIDKLYELAPQRVSFNKFNPVHDLAMVMRKFLKNDKLYLNTFFKGKFDDVKDSLCISVGGDMYCYGKLTWLYYIHEKLKKQNCKTVLWGCSVDDNSFFPESKEDLSRYDMIIARESISYDLLKKNGMKNIKLYPDPAFNLDITECEVYSEFDGKKTVAINISPLMNRYKGDSPLDKNVSSLVNYILENTDCDILFIPHVNGDAEQEDDYTYLKGVASRFGENKRIRVLGKNYNCSELKYIISKCRFLITARTHASIAAYSTGVPCVVLGYSVKSRGIAKDIFGTEENYVLPVKSLKTDEDMKNSFIWLMDNEEQIKEKLASVMPSYIEKSMAAGEEIRKMTGEGND